MTALVGVAALGIGEPSFAASAETTASVLEVTENVFHESSLRGQMSLAAVEVAGEGCTRSNGTLGLHSASGSDNGVLLALHRLVEEPGVCGGHLGNWWHHGSRIGILLGAVSTGTRAHVSVLCGPGFEPVGADWAASAVGGDFVQVELDDEIAKRVEDVCAALLGAGEQVFARRRVVDGNSAVIRLDVLHLIASQSLARNKLGRRQGMGGSLGLASWVVFEDGILLRRGGVGRDGSRLIVSHLR